MDAGIEEWIPAFAGMTLEDSEMTEFWAGLRWLAIGGRHFQFWEIALYVAVAFFLAFDAALGVFLDLGGIDIRVHKE